MNSQPGQIRQVAPYASENAVNQSHVQPRYPVTGQMPALVRAENEPIRHANPQQHSIAANLLSSQGVGPVSRLRTHAPPPYTRPAAVVSRRSESQVAGQQQALKQGSISLGIPRGHRQQLVRVGNSSGAPAVPIQGPPMAALSQPRQALPMHRVGVTAGHGFNPQGVSQINNRAFELHKLEFWRFQHLSLPHLLINHASDPNCTFVWFDPKYPDFIIINYKAYQQGNFTGLDSTLASLLVKEADSTYPFVGWYGECRTHLIVEPTKMSFLPFDARISF
ncbi:hypothetical protein [Endozoicomonas atrinae]|uniref:hypothetical protein n=1 Tax=Endozoicomonas atrinae TaxID=1333660 RepID=UPI001112D392|nr:hypothetical protein [Endozoicomonas atrinae]